MASSNHKEVSERLTPSEDPRQLVIDTAPALIHTALPDGSLDFFNRRWLEYVGLPITDLLGWCWTTAIHPEDVGELVAKWRAALESGEPFEAESRVRRADGQYRWMLHHKVPLRDKQERIVKWYGSSIDIENLKSADERLRLVVDTTPGLLHSARPDGYNDYLNKRWLDYLGLPLEDVAGWGWQAVVHPDDLAGLVDKWKSMLASGEPGEHEARVRRFDGVYRWLWFRAAPLYDGTGKLIKWYGQTTDIDDRKRAEEQLGRSEAYLAEAQRLSRTGSFGWSVTSGELFWSEETLRIFEYDRTTKPTMGLLLQRVHPEDVALVKQTIERASRDAKDFDFEHRLLMPDGSVKYLHVMAHAVSDESGAIQETDESKAPETITCFVGAVMDVTRSKQAEDALRQDQRELRQLIDFLPQHVMVLDTDGHLLEANQMVLDYTGHTLKEMRDKGGEGLVDGYSHPDDSERVWSECQRGLSIGAPFEIERRALGKDGRYRWFLFRYKPLLDKEGRIARWFATATDIEDLKQEEEGIRKENIALREEIVKTSMFEEIVGTSPALQAVLDRVAKVAPTDSTVLITGETGTGKELIARAIHNRSRRSVRAFVSVNCAAIPSALIPSELFGHEKGAFTGATQRRLGRFELAESGTIFLDEIGELPAETQVALLRVLQEHEFQRVGGNRSIRADARVIVASNRDLEAAMAAGTFRSDLFYRLNVFPIEMPPLRERREDIPLLVEYFIDRFARKAGKKIRRINKKTLELLKSYPWPGNIRELQNVIERSVIICEGEDFSVDESWLSRQPVATELKGQVELSQRIAAHEKEAIEAALSESGGRVFGPSGAAAKLGIPRSTLESKIRSLKINKNRFKIANPPKNN